MNRARLLLWSLHSFSILILGSSFASLVNRDKRTGTTLIDLAFLLLNAALFTLVLTGHTRGVKLVLLGEAFSYITLASIRQEPICIAAPVLYLYFILMAGALFQLRGLLAGLSMTTAALAGLSWSGLPVLTAETGIDPAGTRWAICTLVLALATGIVIVMERTFQDTLQRLQQGQETDRRRSAELQQQVSERTAALRQANTELEQALRVRDSFLHVVTHELRTPLMGILGMCQALQTPAFSNLTPQQQQWLQTIEQSGQRLQAIVNDVLEYSALEGGLLQLDLHRCSVDGTCRAVLQRYGGLAAAGQVRLEYQAHATGLVVLADGKRLMQVLSNLVSNAVKFTPKGGTVLVSVRKAARGRAEIEVRDTGIGMTPEDLARIYTPNFQADAEDARRHGGIGLGLPIARGLVRLMNGDLVAKSRPGKGSTFLLRLPRAG